ncbi:sugar phosphate isomerase/epimerase [bacterium]|nr:sugar phosphate isomerase/epimerase [bacterium]
MKLGIDSFCLHPLDLDVFGQMAFARRHGFDGLHGGISLDDDDARLADIRAYARQHGLYTEVDAGLINPCCSDMSRDDLITRTTRRIERAARHGWREIRAALGNGDERYTMPVPWTEQLEQSDALIRALGPVLRASGCRINLETHGDTTTFELIRLIEHAGPDILGICLDTANVFCHAEDPVLATRRAAPYTHMTHIKDAIVFFIDTGLRRQTLPAGRGAIPWETVLPALAEHAPALHLSIEDHKWFFEAHIFDEHWLSLHPDLTRDELARVVRTAWLCQQRIASGAVPDPAAYEAIPYKDELETRLETGRDYLRRIITRLGLPAD